MHEDVGDRFDEADEDVGDRFDEAGEDVGDRSDRSEARNFPFSIVRIRFSRRDRDRSNPNFGAVVINSLTNHLFFS